MHTPSTRETRAVIGTKASAWAWAWAWAWGLASAFASTAACAQAAPAPGRYGGELCVTTPASVAPGCGPAEVELQAGGSARVSISDISYRLQIKSSQVQVVLMHGGMQIDEFVSPYEWVGRTLQFSDVDKRARYALRLNDPKALKPTLK